MKSHNADEVLNLLHYAIERKLDISFTEEMSLREVGRPHGESFCASKAVRALISRRYGVLDSAEQSGGPARHVRLTDFPDTRIGFISPNSHNFCS